MTVPGNLSSPLLATAAADAAAAAAGPIKSLRFNDSDSASLSKTFSSAGNRRTFTFSCWVKRCTFGVYHTIISAGNSSPNQRGGIRFRDDDKLEVTEDSLGFDLRTTRVFRDPSAWYHIVVAVDTTQSTASNRIKLYVNGVEEDTFDSSSYPSQNFDCILNSGDPHRIGELSYAGNIYELDGYLAALFFIDGSALDCTSFGAFDDNNVWQSAAYSGTFGTNGFHLLDFANESTVGHDSSGNNNDFTANNLSAEASFKAVAGTHAGKDGISFNGTDAEVTLTSNSDVNPGSGVFTFECYAYALSGGSAEFGIYDGSPGGNGSFVLRRVDNGNLMVERHNTAFDITGGSFSEGAWHHVALTRDSSNNVRLFIDGTQSGSTSTSNTHNYQGTFRLGRTNNAFTNGYISNLRLIKGTCLYTSNFTAPTGNLGNVTNTKLLMAQSTTSVTAATVKPSGVTISGSADSTVVDVLFDVPTNGTQSDTGAGGEVSGNYATLNPVAPHGLTLSNGNLDGSGSVIQGHAPSTIFASSGKFYCEFTLTTYQNDTGVGVAASIADPGEDWIGEQAYMIGYLADGRIFQNSSSTSYSSYAAGDVIGAAFDADTGKVWFHKNGTYQNSGDPAAGTGQVGTITGGYALGFTFRSVGGAGSFNFGARSFEYSAPSGFKALNTASMSAATIAQGKDYFNAITYTGTGSNPRAITGVGHSSDFVWIKARNAAAGHAIMDSVRGTGTNALASHTSGGEGSETYGQMSSFDSDGFTVTFSANGEQNVNFNNRTYVAWSWEAASSTASNTDGSITSSVRASQTSGMSIVTYTGNNTAGATVGHGLNAAPDFMMIKRRSGTENWLTYNRAIGATKAVFLNLTDSPHTNAAWFNDTDPSSSVFTLGSGNAVNNSNGDTYVAYCFAPVAGFSAFGTYEGNGSFTDGPFIHLGFRPAFFLLKSTTTNTYNWHIIDNTRSPANPVDDVLRPNLANSEVENYGGIKAIFCANGIKLNANWLNVNNDGDTFVYAAFAESPFQANGGLAR